MAAILSTSDRKVILGLLVVLLIYLSIRYWMNPMYVSDPPPDVPPRAGELMDRIDPNTADVATLSALPMIGPKRAADIVAHREAYQVQHPNQRAFTCPADLKNVKGIGDATVEMLEPYLMFQSEP